MEHEVRIDQSADGSQTVYSEHYGQHYHSIHGAIQESEHVFIKEGFDKITTPKVNILEIGFGTGLNALLSLIRGELSEKEIKYHGIELHPLDESIIKQLSYCSQLSRMDLQEAFILMHNCRDNHWIPITKSFHLKKSFSDFQSTDFGDSLDLVYFDAFGPGCQPQLWSELMFQRLFTSMSNGGVLTTYSAKGDVRRAMISAGFSVKKRPGPPGKREMLVAIK